MPDNINSSAPFNNPGELFNSDVSPKVRSVLFPIKQPLADAGDDGRLPSGRRPAPLTLVKPIEDPEPVETEPLVGNFSLVRAARVAHQHAVSFWSSDVATGEIGFVTGSDPTAEQAEDLYTDFLVFNYVPAEMLPPREFVLASLNPTGRVGFLQGLLAFTGATASTVLARPTTGQEDIPVATLIPPPFGTIVEASLGTSSYYVRSTGLNYRAQEFTIG